MNKNLFIYQGQLLWIKLPAPEKLYDMGMQDQKDVSLKEAPN